MGGCTMYRKSGLSALADSAEIFDVARTPTLPARVAEFSSDNGMRFMDVILATFLFVLILPVIALIALAIKCTSVGPVIFAHDRVGRCGRMFPCLKFRSMALDADERLKILLATDPVSRAEWTQTHKLRKDPRITPFGAILRKTSLDELPQLFNVLRGEMSLVGPRPIVPAEVWRYGRYISHYHAVRPGITGMWQINGRSNVSYRRRVALDVVYIRSRSVLLNIYILGMTVPRVILAKDTY